MRKDVKYLNIGEIDYSKNTYEEITKAASIAYRLNWQPVEKGRYDFPAKDNMIVRVSEIHNIRYVSLLDISEKVIDVERNILEVDELVKIGALIEPPKYYPEGSRVTLEFYTLFEISTQLLSSKASIWNATLINRKTKQTKQIYLRRNSLDNSIYPYSVEHERAIVVDPDHLFCLSNWDFGDKPLCKYEKTLPELVREGQDFDGIVGGENE